MGKDEEEQDIEEEYHAFSFTFFIGHVKKEVS